MVHVRAQNNVKIAGMIGKDPGANPGTAVRELVFVLGKQLASPFWV